MELFTIKKKVYYHDTDCGGVVYYANYLKYFEEARTEYFLSKGVDLRKCIKSDFFFVVANVEIKYKKGARYGDKILVTTKIEKIKSASIEFLHEVKKDESLLVECKTTLVCVDPNFRPKAIPDDILVLLKK